MGAVDNRNTLILSDDAAHKILGGKWRMPTKKEFQELIDNCTWEINNGGFVLKSKLNGKSIFLPWSMTGGPAADGDYWSNSLDINNCNSAYTLSIHVDRESSDIGITSRERRYELPIRPVLDVNLKE